MYTLNDKERETIVQAYDYLTAIYHKVLDDKIQVSDECFELLSAAHDGLLDFIWAYEYDPLT